MSIVVGFVPTNEGRAALRRAAEEAQARSTRLVVINSNRGGKDLSREEAERYEAELEEVQAERAAPASTTRCARWCAGWSPPRTSSRWRRRPGPTSS
ncbi:hypothetical protein GCM10025868_44590 [Angustibacter aerolatus]|uniref:UspA domain-containing protein n=1 Tax=Angustibacter aerolatus TaxID=1162965 RepID=A0ABQ6JPZ0_9ACTN|nr:hypothetical protein [Angustibacter aerolatus]GMA89209.1 hypothetical protein GCM10025868_44590 [Angustibacter aerolatus]